MNLSSASPCPSSRYSLAQHASDDQAPLLLGSRVSPCWLRSLTPTQPLTPLLPTSPYYLMLLTGMTKRNVTPSLRQFEELEHTFWYACMHVCMYGCIYYHVIVYMYVCINFPAIHILHTERHVFELFLVRERLREITAHLTHLAYKKLNTLLHLRDNFSKRVIHQNVLPSWKFTLRNTTVIWVFHLDCVAYLLHLDCAEHLSRTSLLRPIPSSTDSQRCNRAATELQQSCNSKLCMYFTATELQHL